MRNFVWIALINTLFISNSLCKDEIPLVFYSPRTDIGNAVGHLKKYRETHINLRPAVISRENHIAIQTTVEHMKAGSAQTTFVTLVVSFRCAKSEKSVLLNVVSVGGWASGFDAKKKAAVFASGNIRSGLNREVFDAHTLTYLSYLFQYWDQPNWSSFSTAASRANLSVEKLIKSGRVRRTQNFSHLGNK